MTTASRLEERIEEAFLRQLKDLRRDCQATESAFESVIERIGRTDSEPSDDRRSAMASARNLLHYLTIRREDLRSLHTPLAELGLSSLGRIEPHVLENLNGVIGHLERAMGSVPEPTHTAPPISLSTAHELLEARTAALLGPGRHHAPSARGSIRIMVTLPAEAARDPSLVRSLLAAGMDCARINTAHDGPDEWIRMCEHVRTESARTDAAGRGECRILMDLAGPKLRTGEIRPGPEVLRIKPTRDALGRTTRDATVALRAADAPWTNPGEVPVPRPWLMSLESGDAIELFDTRGRRRVLHVDRLDITAGDLRVMATSDRTVYVGTGGTMRLLRPHGRERECRIGSLPAIREPIIVRPRDRVRLALRERIGHPAEAGGIAVLTTTLPEAFARARVGESVWIDDGRIGAVIEEISEDSLVLRVVHASAKGDPIHEDKGINLPDTDIPVHGITEQDREVLPIAARHADIVGMSFVREASDVRELRARLDELGGERVGTILKIETRRAFDHLPSLLLAALEGPSAGVMIARGDLAVEVGYERLAEVQEEILWLCEAAHMPVIWATQVLETMAKTGRPSRAEVTDAAMGERAECVMLNKGPHIVEAVRFLDGLMGRMQEHQSKKRTILRALNVARRFAPDPQPIA